MSQAEYFATPDLDFSFPTRLGIVQQVAVSPAAVAKGKGVHSAMNPSFGDIYDRYQKLTLTTHLPAVIACSETLSLSKDGLYSAAGLSLLSAAGANDIGLWR